MDKSQFKIRLKQRWLFKSDRGTTATAYIAEVTQHSNGSDYATIKIQQVMELCSGLYLTKGQTLYDIWLLSDSNWSYMIGQDKP